MQSIRKKQVYFLLAFVLIAGMGFLIAFFSLPKHQNPILPGGVNSPEVGSTYVSHGPFTFEDDGDLAAALLGGGTQDNPYLITGLNISHESEDYCVSIQNTRKHLLISNCYFYVVPTMGGCFGISMENATNVIVLNCIFSNETGSSYSSAWGIDATNSTDLEISGNTFQKFEFTKAVIFQNCSRAVLEKNYFTRCYAGIWIGYSSSNITIANNYMERCYAAGVYIENSANLKLTGNFFCKLGNGEDRVGLSYNYYLRTLNSVNVVQTNNTVIYWPYIHALQCSATSVNITVNQSYLWVGVVTGGISPFKYQWNFGDSTSNSTDASAYHTFAKTGLYDVILTITDAEGDSYVYKASWTVVSPTPTNQTCPEYRTSPDSGIPGFPVEVLGVIGVCTLAISIAYMKKHQRKGARARLS